MHSLRAIHTGTMLEIVHLREWDLVNVAQAQAWLGEFRYFMNIYGGFTLHLLQIQILGLLGAGHTINVDEEKCGDDVRLTDAALSLDADAHPRHRLSARFNFLELLDTKPYMAAETSFGTLADSRARTDSK